MSGTNPSTLLRTYLDEPMVKFHLQAIERSYDSHDDLYRRVITTILQHFFTPRDRFDVFQESRGGIASDEARPCIAVLKTLAPPGGSPHAYDYCLVESTKGGRSWSDATDELRKRCLGTENLSRQVYGIAHSGLYVQTFTADDGVLTAMGACLHLGKDVDQVTGMLEDMKRSPLPVL